MDEEIVLILGHTEQIRTSIDTVQNLLDGKPLRACDYAPLIGIKSILEAMRDRKGTVRTAYKSLQSALASKDKELEESRLKIGSLGGVIARLYAVIPNPSDEIKTLVKNTLGKPRNRLDSSAKEGK